jgi:hypothetical protein
VLAQVGLECKPHALELIERAEVSAGSDPGGRQPARPERLAREHPVDCRAQALELEPAQLLAR